jgi:hypothetical protein
VAVGADYDMAATPGFQAGGHEYYTLAGAEPVRRAGGPRLDRPPAEQAALSHSMQNGEHAGSVTAFCHSMGTANSLMGVSDALRPRGVFIQAHEPAGSAAISGGRT